MLKKNKANIIQSVKTVRAKKFLLLCVFVSEMDVEMNRLIIYRNGIHILKAAKERS
jgi:hypothetical protein